MKKLLTVILAISLILSPSACGTKLPEVTFSEEETSTATETEAPVTTAIQTEKEEPELPVARDFSWTLENGVLTVNCSDGYVYNGERTRY